MNLSSRTRLGIVLALVLWSTLAFAQAGNTGRSASPFIDNIAVARYLAQ